MNEPERVTREQALEAVAQSTEVHLSVDVFTVSDFVRVTKREVRELIARRQGECLITITHGGAKVWFESMKGST